MPNITELVRRVRPGIAQQLLPSDSVLVMPTVSKLIEDHLRCNTDQSIERFSLQVEQRGCTLLRIETEVYGPRELPALSVCRIGGANDDKPCGHAIYFEIDNSSNIILDPYCFRNGYTDRMEHSRSWIGKQHIIDEWLYTEQLLIAAAWDRKLAGYSLP